MRRESDKWFNRIVRDSRYNDRCRGRVIDPTKKFITTEALLAFQQAQQNKCWYCMTELQWLERRSNPAGLTLERRDNTIPHYTSNCIGLCCKRCNSKRICREKGLLMHYFNLWKHRALTVRVQHDDTRSASYVN